MKNYINDMPDFMEKTMKKVTLLYILIVCGTYSTQAQLQQSRCFYSDRIHAFASSGTTIYAGTKKGIIRSNDMGVRWQNKSSGLINLHITSMATVGTLLYAGTERGLFKSSDNGETWLGTALSSVRVISLISNGNEIYINLGDKIYRIKDKVKPELFSINLPFDKFIDIVIHNNRVYVHGHYGIYTTDDDGFNWKSFNNGLPMLGINTLYSAGKTLFSYVESEGIYRSNDNGETWHKAANYTKHPIVKFIKNGGDIIAISHSEIFISTDDGITWTMEENSWNSSQLTTVYTFNGIIFIGTKDAGIYWKVNNKWENVGTITVGTTNNVWKPEIQSITTGVENSENAQNNFTVSIFPMPAKESITVHNNTNIENGTYSIINHIGEIVQQGIIPAKTHTIDIHTLPAGMYIFSMDMGGKGVKEKILVQ